MISQSLARGRSAHDVGEGWTVADARELYEIARWGQGYFAIGENGHIIVHPTKEAHRSIDLKQLLDDLRLRGIHVPTLIRFRDILQHRVQDIHDAFRSAIAQQEYSYLEERQSR
jgi:arginine decarboxylase